MDIKVPSDQMEKLVSAAIMAQLTPDARENIIRDAITALLTPKKESWQDRAVSPLNGAFREAVERTVRKLVIEYVDNDQEFVAQLRAVVQAGVTKALTSEENRERLADQIATLVSKVLVGHS